MPCGTFSIDFGALFLSFRTRTYTHRSYQGWAFVGWESETQAQEIKSFVDEWASSIGISEKDYVVCKFGWKPLSTKYGIRAKSIQTALDFSNGLRDPSGDWRENKTPAGTKIFISMDRNPRQRRLHYLCKMLKKSFESVHSTWQWHVDKDSGTVTYKREEVVKITFNSQSDLPRLHPNLDLSFDLDLTPIKDHFYQAIAVPKPRYG